MDYRRIEEIYDEQFIDRDWWGNFPMARNLLDRDLGTTDLLKLVPGCGGSAFHVARHQRVIAIEHNCALPLSPKLIEVDALDAGNVSGGRKPTHDDRDSEYS